MMMARGMVVVDENLAQLVGPIKDRNIHVITPPPGMQDEVITRTILPWRIFITNNTQDFISEAPYFYIGIVSLGFAFIDKEPDGLKNITVKIISSALSKYKCWSRRDGFLLELKEGRKA